MAMSDNTPIIGDGVLTIPIDEGKTKMAADGPVDLPPNVAAQLQQESIGNIQMTNASGRGISQMAAGVLQAAMARNFDKMGTEEARAISGLNATPIGGPTNAQK
jgi:flagellar basal body rod protein FlgF